MAIDSAEKRLGMLGIVTPNASKDAEWRAEMIELYPGISYLKAGFAAKRRKFLTILRRRRIHGGNRY